MGKQGFIKVGVRLRDERLLSVRFIDVGQGDACLIEAPNGSRVLVDGGETQQVARYLARIHWPETKAGKTIEYDAVLISHEDADHYAGPSQLFIDAGTEKREFKRIRFCARRIFHNGLVKCPSSKTDAAKTKRSETELLGPSVEHEGSTYVCPPVEDPAGLADDELNRPFWRWKQAIEASGQRTSCSVVRLDHESASAFDFFGEVDV